MFENTTIRRVLPGREMSLTEFPTPAEKKPRTADAPPPSLPPLNTEN
jgi:hypothetical protein